MRFIVALLALVIPMSAYAQPKQSALPPLRQSALPADTTPKKLQGCQCLVCGCGPYCQCSGDKCFCPDCASLKVRDGWKIQQVDDPRYWSYASDPLPERLTSTVNIVDPKGNIHATLSRPSRQQVKAALEAAKAQVSQKANPFRVEPIIQGTTVQRVEGRNTSYQGLRAPASISIAAPMMGPSGVTEGCSTGG